MNTYPPFGQGRGFGYGPMVDHMHQTDPALAWATFALVLLLVLAAGAFAIVLASRGGPRRRMHFRGRRPDALEVLRMRFASGQMTRDEFLQATSDLTANAPAVAPVPPPA